MNEQKKQKLLEQYDDAAFALLMDEYAETEGARLMAEFEAAQAAGQVPEMPAELDEQCRRMIRRDRAKKRGKQAARRFGKTAVKAAVAVLVFIGLMTTVVMSVDALRMPVLNYIVDYYERYISITTGESSNATNHENETFSEDLCALLDEFLPDDYFLDDYSVDAELTYVLFRNSNGDTVSYSIYSAGWELNIDIENAEYSEIVLAGYPAILIQKHGYQLFWTDDLGTTHCFRASALTEEEVNVLCNTLIITK